MAYNNGQKSSFTAPAGRPAPAQKGGFRSAASGEKREFVEDPNKVGIGYEKESKTGGANYISVTLTKDLPAGTKFFVYANDKVKNRTEKTPTHVLKLPKVKAE